MALSEISQGAAPGIKIGDRVRLTERAAKTFSAGRGKFDWTVCRGTVVRITRRGSTVFVRWDGRSYLDPWPILAIERCGDGPDC